MRVWIISLILLLLFVTISDGKRSMRRPTLSRARGGGLFTTLSSHLNAWNQ